MSKAPKLSLLIPTYKRAGKLCRNISYLSELVRYGFPADRLSEVQILVADGSPCKENSASHRKLAEMVSDLPSSVNLKFLEGCEESFFARIGSLGENADGEYVSLLGDEDLLVFESLPKVLEAFDSDQQLVSVSGAFIDIHGFQQRKLKLSSHEGWLDGYKVAEDTGVARFDFFNKMSGMGSSSISYAFIRNELFRKISSFVSAHSSEFTYCGFENFLNAIQLFSGNLLKLDAPLYLRDRTFVGRATDESLWSNEFKDSNIPSLVAKFLVGEHVPMSYQQIVDLVQGSPSSGIIPGSTFFLDVRSYMDNAQPYTSNFLANKLSKVTYSACYSSWVKTFKLAFAGYNPKDLGYKSPIIEFAAAIKRKGMAVLKA